MPFTKNNKSGMTGRKHSLISREKQRISKLGSNNHRWRGGICIRNGYIYLLRPNHPNSNACGYVSEHRLNMENKICRYLNKNELVHHIDENKLNNNISNLRIVTRKEHAEIHRDKLTKSLRLSSKRINIHTIICINCKKVFSTWLSNKYKFCSRKCYWFNMKGKPSNVKKSKCI